MYNYFIIKIFFCPNYILGTILILTLHMNIFILPYMLTYKGIPTILILFLENSSRPFEGHIGRTGMFLSG